MFDSIAAVRCAVDELVGACAPAELSPHQAVDAARQLGAIRASLDAVVARVALRVEACHAHRRDGERDSTRSLGRALGSTLTDARYPAELLTALIVAGRECAVAGCGARGYLEIDHAEVDVAAGGPSAWWNLDWLCAVDHRRKTAGWKLGPRDPGTGKRALSPPRRGP